MKPLIAFLSFACVTPDPGAGGRDAAQNPPIEPASIDTYRDTDLPIGNDTDTVETTVEILFYTVNMAVPRADWCWDGVNLTVEVEYWEDWLSYAHLEDATQYCSPVEWTAVRDGMCILVHSTCPADPRDPTFLDCSELPECCGLGPMLGGC